jgi:hypothetical protein
MARLVVLCISVACAQPSAQPAAPSQIVFAPGRGTLYVRLTAAAAGGVDHARLGLERGPARFEADSVPLARGDYIFRDMPIGRYQLIVRRVGYVRLADSVSIRAGLLDTIHLSMRINSGCDIDCEPARRPPWWKFWPR